jgi:hypothetical protein
MARITVEGAQVVVGLSHLERLAAFRGDVRVPLACVREVIVEPDPWGVTDPDAAAGATRAAAGGAPTPPAGA